MGLKNKYCKSYQPSIVMKEEEKSTNAEDKTINPSVYAREEYGQGSFWEDRYKLTAKSYFDWYAEFPELKETF